MTITLVNFGNINHECAEFSINKSLECFKFDDAFIMFDRPMTGVRYYHKEYILDDTFRFQTLDGNHAPWCYDNYNIFILKNIADFINTDFMINIHYDGFCVNNQHWTDEFLEYDYIGSPAHRDWYPLVKCLKEHDLYDMAPSNWFNGGGGFTLRSKKLLRALQDPRIDTVLSNKNFQRAEDMTISLKFRKLLEQDYGIRFAPIDICLKWCTELLSGHSMSFGFHGWYNIPLFLTEEECIWYMDRMNRADVFPGSPIVKQYIATCYIKNYNRAIDHINDILNDQEKWKKKVNSYAR